MLSYKEQIDMIKFYLNKFGIRGKVSVSEYRDMIDATRSNVSIEVLRESMLPMIKAAHPEIQDGEIFLSNINTIDYNNNIGWKTKRLGDIAYDTVHGERVKKSLIEEFTLYPVFVNISEIEKEFM